MNKSTIIITLYPGSYNYLNSISPLFEFMSFDNMKNMFNEIMDYYENPAIEYNNFLAVLCGKYVVTYAQFQKAVICLEELACIFKALSNGKIKEFNESFPSIRTMLSSATEEVLK